MGRAGAAARGEVDARVMAVAAIGFKSGRAVGGPWPLGEVGKRKRERLRLGEVGRVVARTRKPCRRRATDPEKKIQWILGRYCLCVAFGP